MSQEAIFSRRSIRKFKSAGVPQEALEKICEAGRAAPSAKNRQPWKGIILEGKSKEEFLTCMEKGILREERQQPMLPGSAYGIPDARNTLRIMKEAPVLIAVLNTNGRSPFEKLDTDERFMEICDSLSIGAFIQNMILEAEELGIGSLWIANTCFAYPELVSWLDTEHQLVGAVALGYADELPLPRPRKPIGEIFEQRLV